MPKFVIRPIRLNSHIVEARIPKEGIDKEEIMKDFIKNIKKMV